MSILRSLALLLYRISCDIYLGFQIGIPLIMPKPNNNLMQFEVVSGNDSQEDNDESSEDVLAGPSPRSGHKIVISEDYIYLIGGYASLETGGHIYEQVWRFNLLLQTWRKMKTPRNFPSHLASFGVCHFLGCSERFLLFGGTGYPFGTTVCSKVHLISIPLGEEGSISVSDLQIKGERMDNRYGHAFKSMRDPVHDREVYYCIGGTDGHIYDLDVFVLRYLNDGFYWEKEASTPSNWLGLYKFDVAAYDGKFYFFGGGTSSTVKSTDELYVYDTKEKAYSTVITSPDPQHGYPSARKCHSVTEFEGEVIITGGVGVSNDDNVSPVFDDVWAFNLCNKKWRKLNTHLTFGLFFHDAVVSEEGCLYVYGGVRDIAGAERTSVCQKMWLKPPSLKTLAMSSIVKNYKNRNFLKIMDLTNSNFIRFVLPLIY